MPPEVASMAKAFVGEAGVELAQNCWQVFGGIGYTWEHDFSTCICGASRSTPRSTAMPRGTGSGSAGCTDWSECTDDGRRLRRSTSSATRHARGSPKTSSRRVTRARDRGASTTARSSRWTGSAGSSASSTRPGSRASPGPRSTAGVVSRREHERRVPGGSGVVPDARPRRRRWHHVRRLCQHDVAPCVTRVPAAARPEDALGGGAVVSVLLRARAPAPTSPACTTRATRDGDRWMLTGSKVWTSGAVYADYGMCLARSNWDVPKHRGAHVVRGAARHAGRGDPARSARSTATPSSARNSSTRSSSTTTT